MSDRINELANEIGAGWQDCPFCGQRPRYRGIRPVISWDVESDGPKCDAPWHTLHPGDALTELATIAREAEAMCEWLAERLEESDDTVLMADTWIAAAREAEARALKAEAERDVLLAEHEAIEEVRPQTMDATIYHDAVLFPPTMPRG